MGEFQKVEYLRRSDNCLFEVTYFYLGRLRRKNGNRQKAIEAFEAALQLMAEKFSGQGLKHAEQRQFLLNLKAKIYYKMSKCFR